VSPAAWRIVLVIAAISAVAGGCCAARTERQANAAPSRRFRSSPILKDRAVALITLATRREPRDVDGIAVFIAASERARRGAHDDVTAVAALATFAVVGSGAIGCWLGGRYADRWGRTLVTSVAMLVSGVCALNVGLFYGWSLIALLPVLLLWGVSIVADSAQFSAAVSELAPREYVGTALTLQTSLGFLLTAATIYLLPTVAAAIGWRWSMSVLAIGPAVGVWAMLTLRHHSAALRLAGGKR
jgi:MFS family permease